MNRVRLAFAFVTSLGLAGSAAAHPGHGPDATSVLHYLSEPMHAPAVLGVLALAGFGVWLLGGRRARRAVDRSPRR